MYEPDFVLPAGLHAIEEYAFSGTPVEVVYVPEGVTEMGTRAFGNCDSLRQIWIPASLTSYSAFSLSGTSAVVVGNSETARQFAIDTSHEYVEAAE